MADEAFDAMLPPSGFVPGEGAFALAFGDRDVFEPLGTLILVLFISFLGVLLRFTLTGELTGDGFLISLEDLFGVVAPFSFRAVPFAKSLESLLVLPLGEFGTLICKGGCLVEACDILLLFGEVGPSFFVDFFFFMTAFTNSIGAPVATTLFSSEDPPNSKLSTSTSPLVGTESFTEIFSFNSISVSAWLVFSTFSCDESACSTFSLLLILWKKLFCDSMLADFATPSGVCSGTAASSALVCPEHWPGY
mmetsp:Transcript_30525/g.40331  ORF Transcript_30525/g.40331 Transcript_30525/m.40331 type:complete len:249 (+) Transcript_30525:1815-2561(+)